MRLFILSPEPFHNSRLSELQWRELDQIFTEKIDSRLLANRVVALCHHGDTASTAASVLQARCVACFSVKGGAQAHESLSRASENGE